ncbi:hypothetical protein KTE51_13230 [Burkholderia multivorans]|nr:hypothetical protein [Burkholderia multivorans]
MLAAQIHGGVAVLSTAGLTTAPSVLITAVAVLAMSSLDLGVAALLFAVGLLASNLVLLHALVASGGLPVYLHAWPSFIREMQGASGIDTFADVIAVGFLVITGSDYQQFVIAARRPLDACLGCALAGVFLIAVGFLPAATVVAALHSGQLSGLTDDAGAIPWIVLHSNAHLGPFCLGMIMLAALGSGTAVTRAMTSALLDLPPLHRSPCNHSEASRCGNLLSHRHRRPVDRLNGDLAEHGLYFGRRDPLRAGSDRPCGYAALCIRDDDRRHRVFPARHRTRLGAHYRRPRLDTLAVGLTASACPLLAQRLAWNQGSVRR